MLTRDPLFSEFARLLKDYGHHVVHIHKTSVLCPKCSSGQSGSGLEVNPDCDVCLGRGYQVVLKPELVRASIYDRSNFDAFSETPIGILGPENNIYFMKHTASPTQGDLIAEVTWDKPGDEVVKYGNVLAVHHIYETKTVKAFRGQNGEVVYFKITTRPTEIEETRLAPILKTKRPT